MTALILAALIAGGAAGQAAASQPPSPVNRCVACHLAASRPTARIHLADWSRSAHARSAVTCDRCHGGDPSATDLARAHRGVVNSRYATSRVSRQNLPATCGDCHTPEFDAFRKSGHYPLVEQNLHLGPVCSDCHGATATSLPQPSALEARCAGCHVAESVGTDRPRLARQALQDVGFVRAILQRAARSIEREPDLARFERLQRERREARNLLTSAIDALHTFNLPDVSERLLRACEAAEHLGSMVLRSQPSLKE